MVTLLNKVEDQVARTVCQDYGSKPEALLEILHSVQEHHGFLSDAALRTIANTLNLSRAEVHGVVSFYHDYKREKSGALSVKICRAEACQSVGCDDLIDTAERKYGVSLDKGGESIALEATYCLGNCALGPAVMIDNELYGRVDAQRLEEVVDHHVSLAKASK